MKPEIIIYISFLSLAIAALSLGWNIYRDVIIKPKLKVNVSVSNIIESMLPEELTKIVISAVNLGPGSITCRMIHARKSSWLLWLFRKTGHVVIMQDSEEPLGGKLPVKLEVGEGLDLLLPYNINCFLAEDLNQVGIIDSFGNIHWSSKKQIQVAKIQHRKDFAEQQDSG